MKTSYVPDQRAIACRILTFAGWIDGTFHVPAKHGFLETLARGEEMFRLTGVLLPGQTSRHAFFAVHRAAVIGVAPPDGEPVALSLPAGARVTRRVSWLLASGVVDGDLEVHESVRLSDFILHQTGFIPLRDATVMLRGEGGGWTAEPVPLFAVQANRAIGVSEVD